MAIYYATPYIDTGTITTASTNIYNPWVTWCDTSTATSTAYTWTTWNTSTAYTWTTWNNIYVPPQPAILTPEQIASERARQEERNRIWRAERAARKAADDRAQELLLTHLTDEQREAIKAKNFFVIEGGKSKHKYRIWTNKGVHGNIERLDNHGRAVANLCVQLKETVCPNGDHFLAQKLMLELAEDDILKVANINRLAA